MNLPPSTIKVFKYIQQNAENGIADIRQRDILIYTGVSYGSLYTGLRLLEKSGFIAVVRDPLDRRTVRYHIKRRPLLLGRFK